MSVNSAHDIEHMTKLVFFVDVCMLSGGSGDISTYEDIAKFKEATGELIMCGLPKSGV